MSETVIDKGEYQLRKNQDYPFWEIYKKNKKVGGLYTRIAEAEEFIRIESNLCEKQAPKSKTIS